MSQQSSQKRSPPSQFSLSQGSSSMSRTHSPASTAVVTFTSEKAGSGRGHRRSVSVEEGPASPSLPGAQGRGERRARKKEARKRKEARPVVRDVKFVHVRVNRLHCRGTYQVCLLPPQDAALFCVFQRPDGIRAYFCVSSSSSSQLTFYRVDKRVGGKCSSEVVNFWCFEPTLPNC